MNHIPFDKTFTTAIFIKQAGLNKEEIQRNYIDKCGLSSEGLVAFDLDYGGKKKPSATLRKEYLTKLLKGVNKLGITYILCCDTEYFKTLTKQQKVEPCLGYAFDCKIEGYEHLQIFYSLNHQVLFYKPDLITKIKLSIKTLNSYKTGFHVELGSDIIHSASYPETLNEISDALDSLHQYKRLSADFEAFSLKHYTSGLGTVAFAWNKHEGIAFCIDYKSTTPVDISKKGQKTKWQYAKEVFNREVRALLKKFFETYEGTLIWHNISFDAYIAVYQLWMTDLLDQEGMLTGIEVMTKKFECTKLITYLATNSCAGNKLSLKEQAHEYAGAWAVDDITDIRLIHEAELLKYNLVDCLSTWFTYEKNYPQMVMDNQKEIYTDLFKPCVLDVIQMQLTGFCLDISKVLEAEDKLTKILNATFNTLINLPTAKKFIADSIDAEVISRNKAYKKKVITAVDANFVFNPNSNPQMQVFLYEYLALPIIDLTKTKQPAIGNKTLDKITKLINDPEKLSALNALIDYIKVGKLLSAFIPAFKEALLAPDGYHYLYGSFNLGGTVSGRLSSCLVGDSMVHCTDGIKRIVDVTTSDTVPTHTSSTQRVLNVFDNGLQPVYKITLEDGKSLTCTSNHRLLTEKGFLSLEDMYESTQPNRYGYFEFCPKYYTRLPKLTINGDTQESTRKNLSYNHSSKTTTIPRRTTKKKKALFGRIAKQSTSIKSIEYMGIQRVYDMEVEADHCYIANDIYVHNSNPNMQNLPSGSTYAKIIKECFISPKGTVFCGADYASLEDRIDALLTKDPNKIKVYTDGYDGHSLRAFSYFGDQMPDIVNTIESINSIKDKYPTFRQDSKAPTFALTYLGKWFTLVKNCGFTEKVAKQIEFSYHDMYQASDKWKAAKITQASKDGFAVVAFGLKVRTPLLSQVVLGNNKTPFEAEAEGRTVGNALGQSYGLLNSHAAMQIMKVIRASEYRLDIMLVALIHDAIYFRVKDSFKTIKYLNDVVGKWMSWQELPEIQHEEVCLSGELDIFYPHWGKSVTIPNYASIEEIKQKCVAEKVKRTYS